VSSGGRRIVSGWRQRTGHRPQVFRAAVGAAASERFRLIDQLADQHSVSWLCRHLGVARSGYYAWRLRQEAPGKRAAENAVITAEIEAVFLRWSGFSGQGPSLTCEAGHRP
jgi:hypothetical protein